MNPLKPLSLCAALALCACSSAPIQFYTLVPPVAAPGGGAGAAPQIDVQAVSVPAQVDLPQLVVREGASEVALVEDRQWIAPLGQEIRGALAADLVAQLGAQDVSGLPHPKDAKVYRIKVDIKRFESALGRQASIEAAWTLRAPQAEQPATCFSRAEETVAAGYPALVEGHQRALARVAGQIAEAVKSAQAGSLRCPS